jgi:hypothetical protein
MAESRRKRKRIERGETLNLSVRISKDAHDEFYRKEEKFHRVTNKTVGEFLEKMIKEFKI